MAFRRFNHLNVPEHWEHYWSKYPQGYTILEALVSWVSQVDDMVDNQNQLSTTVEGFRFELDNFIDKFDPKLQDTVTTILQDWQESGFLTVIINESLQTQMDDYEITVNNKLEEFNTKLIEITNKVIRVFSSNGDDTLLVKNAISQVSDNGRIEFYGTFNVDYVQFENKKNIEVAVYGEFKRNNRTAFLYSLILVNGCDGVSFTTPIKTDGNAFSYTDDELLQNTFQRHSFDLRNSKNIHFTSIIDKNTPADVLYVNNVTNLFVDSVYGKNDRLCGRNVVSVISGSEITIASVYGRNIGVVGQPGGVDIEPNLNTEVVRNVSITNIDVTTAGTIGIAVQNIQFATIENIRLEGKVTKLEGYNANPLDYMCIISNAKNVHLDILLVQTDREDKICRGVTLTGVRGLKARIVIKRAASGIELNQTYDFNIEGYQDEINTGALVFVDSMNGKVEMERVSNFGYGVGYRNLIYLAGAANSNILIKGVFRKTRENGTDIKVINVPLATAKQFIRFDGCDFRGFVPTAIFFPNSLPETLAGIDVTNTLGITL